jgi:hypothetical protein
MGFGFRMNKTLKHAKGLITATIGFTIVLIGIALLFLPGPALVIIPFGLGILATEFLWAKRLLQKIRKTIRRVEKNDSASTADTENDSNKEKS